MPPAARLQDTCTGHGCFPSRPCIGGCSPNVSHNYRLAQKIGAIYDKHCCGDPIVCHKGKLACGSGTVSINGLPAGRVGDCIDCGSNVQTGSSNVTIGG